MSITFEEGQDALIEDVEWMVETGESGINIPRRLGTAPSSLTKRLRRAGRPDLAAYIDREISRDRRRSA